MSLPFISAIVTGQGTARPPVRPRTRFGSQLSQAGFRGGFESRSSVLGKEILRECQDRGSIPRSCSSAAVRLVLESAGRSRTSPRISGSTARRCASGCARPRPTGLAAGSADQRGARGDQARCERENCELRQRERDPEGRVACFSPRSSTQTDRSEPLHRRAPRALRGRADLPDPGRVGVRLLPARQTGERSPASSRTSGCSAVIRERPRGQLLRLRLPADVEGAAARRRARSPRCRVQRLMRATGSRAPSAAASRGAPRSRPAARSGRPDLVQRDFTADAPERALGRRLHLPALLGGRRVLRVRHRRLSAAAIVGWQFAAHMRTDLVLDALRMALGPRAARRRRRAGPSQRRAAAQYTAIDYTQILDDHGVLASIGIGRRRLRQRDGRELRRQLQDRADPRPRLAHPLPARARDRRIRRLVQPRPPAQRLGDIPPAEFEQIYAERVDADPHPDSTRPPTALPGGGLARPTPTE